VFEFLLFARDLYTMEDQLLGRRYGKGYIQPTSIDDHAFNEQYKSFHKNGYSMDLHSNRVIGSYENYVEDQKQEKLEYETNKTEEKKKKRKIKDVILEDDDEDDAAGPWAAFKDEKPAKLFSLPPGASAETTALVAKPAAAPAKTEQVMPPNMYIAEPDEEEEKWERVTERKLNYVLPPRPHRGALPMEAITEFHRASQTDFQGRSWALPPQGVQPIDDYENFNCYLPKKCAHRLGGHMKGVQAIEFFPKYGHLLLSASMDGKCKIWDAQESYQCLRTYHGHSEGIRSMQFSADGKEFLSSGFDRYVRQWDTETGQVKGTFSNRKMGYCVKYYPRDNHLFLMTASDNKIYQWDTRAGSIVQVYNYHLQPVNSITFVDDDKKFVSTSDDKKVLVWEFDIPVPIKYIQDPEMHSIPFLASHPTQPFFVGQSMDNKIVVFTAGEKVKPIKKKTFKGHNNSGYGCQINFSPNGQFIFSGDGLGQLFFWDWKTSKVYRKFQAHDGGPCMGAAWHPQHASRMATCGWDGLIKIWE
jgi:pre-mRNA-processing factor 17